MSSVRSLSSSRPFLIAGTATSALLAGAISSISLTSVPALVATSAPSAISLTIWRAIYENGKAIAPPIALAASIAHLTNAYIHHADSPTRSYYLLGAAASTLAIVPWTLLVMASTNNELMAREAGAAATAGTPNTIELIKHWGNLNIVRSLFPAFGVVLGFMAL